MSDKTTRDDASNPDLAEIRSAMEGAWRPVIEQTSEQRAGVDAEDDAIKRLFRASCDVVFKGRNLMTDSAAPSFVRSLSLLNLSSQPSQSAPVGMTEDQIKQMVNRFLGWRMPKSFRPDGGVSYNRPMYDPSYDYMPSGTNLLNASQATEMVRYMVEGLAAHPVTKAASDGVPDDSKVICPACAHQFRAIPVDVQRELKAASDGVKAFETDEDRAQFERAVDQFADCNETDVGHDLLMKWANSGLLECKYFEVTKAGHDVLASRDGVKE